MMLNLQELTDKNIPTYNLEEEIIKRDRWNRLSLSSQMMISTMLRYTTDKPLPIDNYRKLLLKQGYKPGKIFVCFEEMRKFIKGE